ncbi:MAG: RluA family pseudouridine synthase [Actinomycetota bacterium]|nr:RluA family pseudouridine synthase [Actinomycetota bacterium]
MEFVVDETEAGERIDLIVARHAGVPRAVARAAIAGGEIVLADGPVKPSHRLSVGEVVSGEVVVPEEAKPQPENIHVDVRYEDEHVMVVSKPAGLVTHPVRGHQQSTLVNALLAMGRPLSQTDPLRPGIVHRLDKDTSGLLLIAKDDDTHAFLRDAMKQRRIERHYYALVRGVPTDSGTIEAPIGRHPKHLSLMAVVSGGKSATTHFAVVSATDKVSLLDVKLDTGRTHQIRVHLSHIGHPILGDRVYGGLSELSRSLGIERPMLHAYQLVFPIGDREVVVSGDVPPDMTATLSAAGLGVIGRD